MDTINTSGRRKAAVARAYMSEGKGNVTVNNKDYKDFFPVPTLQYKVTQPFAITETTGKYDVKVNVDGGGITGQAEDGIRDPLWSRGLGDVYKRQLW